MPTASVLRTTTLGATIGGFTVDPVLSATCTYSWKLSVPEATVNVPLAPQNVATWEASHAYGIGANVKPTVRNGHAYTATGTSTLTWPAAWSATER